MKFCRYFEGPFLNWKYKTIEKFQFSTLLMNENEKVCSKLNDDRECMAWMLNGEDQRPQNIYTKGKLGVKKRKRKNFGYKSW